jgi:hypothetical protein
MSARDAIFGAVMGLRSGVDKMTAFIVIIEENISINTEASSRLLTCPAEKRLSLKVKSPKRENILKNE